MPEIEKIHLDMDKSVDTHVWVSHQLGGYCKMCDCDWEEPRACLPCHVALCWAGETDDGASVEVTVVVRAEDKEDALGLISEARRRLKRQENGEAQFCSGAVHWSTRHL